MRYVTPTGLGKQRGKPVRQLGSTEAVVAAIPDGGAIIVAVLPDTARIKGMLTEAGRRHDALQIITANAAAGDETMLRMPADTPIGIDVGAFDRCMPSQYERAYWHLRRFASVTWG